MPELIPFRWPASWRDPARLEILKGTPINCLVGQEAPPFPLGDLAFVKFEPERPPESVTFREGVWPRVLPAKQSEGADAGPTGAPWVDSNCYFVRLAQTLEPGKMPWLIYPPPAGEVLSPDEYDKA